MDLFHRNDFNKNINIQLLSWRGYLLYLHEMYFWQLIQGLLVWQTLSACHVCCQSINTVCGLFILWCSDPEMKSGSLRVAGNLWLMQNDKSTGKNNVILVFFWYQLFVARSEFLVILVVIVQSEENYYIHTVDKNNQDTVKETVRCSNCCGL